MRKTIYRSAILGAGDVSYFSAGDDLRGGYMAAYRKFWGGGGLSGRAVG